LDYTKRYQIEGRLVSIDFKKAFDSVSRDFLFRTLSAFHFGPSFNGSRHFTNISSCVLNNGFSTAPFKIQRGVRQVHPLSSCLFIMVLKILTINIRSNKNIQGITVDGEEIKLEIFADDLTAFLLKCPCDQIFEFHFFTFSCPIRLSYSPWRDLTVIGRIQIVKTFIIPILLYRASMICLDKELLNEANSIIFNFSKAIGSLWLTSW